MRAIQMAFFGTILMLGSIAAHAADPAIGTWKLNVAKSMLSGPAPTSQVRTYVDSAKGMVLTIRTTSVDGKESTASVTFKDDGKDYPIAGNPDADTISVTRVDANTVDSTAKRGGAVVAHGVRSVSKDGKTLTFKQNGTHVGGAKFDDTSIYDRQ